MLHKRFAAVVIVSALAALIAGCAGPRASSVASRPGARSELTGIWRGSFAWVGAHFYTAEGNCIIQVADDGTFTWTATPARVGNNLSRGWNWSGTAIRNGNHVTFRASEGPWATLVRSGDTLYGVMRDPTADAVIMIQLEREGTMPAAAPGSLLKDEPPANR